MKIVIYKTFDEDREYLVNKFRKPVFDPSTGMDDDEIRDTMLAFAQPMIDAGLPKPIIKARCFERACRELRIDLNPHDCFPGFGFRKHARRPLDFVVDKWMVDEDVRIAKQSEEIYALNDAGIHMTWRDFDHSVPDWTVMIEIGYPGLRERARRFRKEHEEKGTLTPEVAAHFDGMEIEVNAVLENIQRLIDHGEKTYPENPRVQREVESLKHLRDGAPQDFYDVLQLIFLHFFYGEHIDRMQVRSLGGPLDVRLYPFYKKDLAEGRYTQEDIREFLACFLMQWGSIDNYWGHPLFLGGTGEKGETLYNEVTYIILDVYQQLAIPTPKIQLKIAQNTPQKLLETALTMVRDHHSSLAFVSEEGIHRVMTHYGCSDEEARMADIYGCYGFITHATTNEIGATTVNMVKICELLLNGGIDPKTGYRFTDDLPELSELKSFDDFYKTWLDCLGKVIENEFPLCNANESRMNEINPSLLYSLTIENSLKTGKDAFFNGNIYNNSVFDVTGYGTAVDSLMAVKRFVFEKKEVSLEEFREILLKNWEGAEKLRGKILKDKYKYGNGLPEVDRYAKEISKFISQKVNYAPNSRGGFYRFSGHGARQFIDLGKKTGATPDGRLAGEEFSKNLSPTMGMDRNGITALINSMTTMDPVDFPVAFPLDVMLHPATVQGKEGLAVLKSLLFTYFKQHGTVVHFNIFDAEELEKAQQEPEKYANLQIRVCGWNVRFVELAKSEQDEYIKRAKNIIE